MCGRVRKSERRNLGPKAILLPVSHVKVHEVDQYAPG